MMVAAIIIIIIVVVVVVVTIIIMNLPATGADRKGRDTFRIFRACDKFLLLFVDAVDYQAVTGWVRDNLVVHVQNIICHVCFETKDMSIKYRMHVHT